ncbi:PSB7-like protein [Mya arenaria]|uniref:PSB7-like protein n=1 Tax=Mya arenaria TaxID=6604 RepID=A0ABY7G7G5_MYAAR|nr:PSB7-like protein [Mya arenaria]
MAAVEAPMPGFSFENCTRMGLSLALTQELQKTRLWLTKTVVRSTISLTTCTGTAADTEMTTQMISSQLELHKLNTARTPRSGSLAAMATFEDRFKPDMEKAEAMKLVRDAIAAGIFNDLGSGSNVDICVITKGKVEYLRPFDEANVKGQREGNYGFKRGTTAILSTEVKKIPFEILATSVVQSDTAMDTA